jgi:hypothetical protein
VFGLRVLREAIAIFGVGLRFWRQTLRHETLFRPFRAL